MILPTIVLSNRRNLPVWMILGKKFKPWNVKDVFRIARMFREQDGHYFTNVFGFEIELLERWAMMLGAELPVWNWAYLPPPSCRNGVILDVGAGCGESAAFYIHQGAQKVIAIEPDMQAFELLVKNVRKNNLNVECINDELKVEHLYKVHDFAKIDAEGGESKLAEFGGELKDCVVEVHSNEIYNELARKFRLSEICYIDSERRGLYYVRGYQTPT